MQDNIESPCACWPGRMCSRSAECADRARQAPAPVEVSDEQLSAEYYRRLDLNEYDRLCAQVFIDGARFALSQAPTGVGEPRYPQPGAAEFNAEMARAKVPGAPVGEVPAGWKLVPTEMHSDQLHDFHHFAKKFGVEEGDAFARSVYAAVLAAAPTVGQRDD